MISDIEKIYGSRLEIIEQLRPTYHQLEDVGYEYRGSESRGRGDQAYLLIVWTRGDWLVRVKHYTRLEKAEIAAFDKDGLLCPLQEALEKDDAGF